MPSTVPAIRASSAWMSPAIVPAWPWTSWGSGRCRRYGRRHEAARRWRDRRDQHFGADEGEAGRAARLALGRAAPAVLSRENMARRLPARGRIVAERPGSQAGAPNREALSPARGPRPSAREGPHGLVERETFQTRRERRAVAQRVDPRHLAPPIPQLDGISIARSWIRSIADSSSEAWISSTPIKRRNEAPGDKDGNWAGPCSS